MTWITKLFFPTFLSSLVLGSNAGALTCEENRKPVQEKAYSAAFEIMFPDKFKSKQVCSWVITAYRDRHRLQLQFDQVVMVPAQDGTCVNKIIVYDGPNNKSKILSSFCGLENLDLQTSSKQAFVVVNIVTHLQKHVHFNLKYSSLEPKHTDVAVGVILICVFCGIIGSLCCLGVCCGLFKNVVKSRAANRSQGSLGNGGTSDSSSNGRGRGGQAASDLLKDDGIAARFMILLLKVFKIRVNNDDSSGTNGQGQTQNPQQQQQTSNRQQRHGQNNQGRQHQNIHQPRTDAVVSQDDRITDTSNTQDSFCFQDIPVSSFTSDPLAVKPPTYEDCLKNTNPLYLYHQHDGESMAFYNRAFDIKDSSDPDSTDVGILTPPPPYTEVGDESSPPHSDQPERNQASTTQNATRNTATANQPQYSALFRDPPPPFTPTAPPLPSNLSTDTNLTSSANTSTTDNHLNQIDSISNDVPSYQAGVTSNTNTAIFVASSRQSSNTPAQTRNTARKLPEDDQNTCQVVQTLTVAVSNSYQNDAGQLTSKQKDILVKSRDESGTQNLRVDHNPSSATAATVRSNIRHRREGENNTKHSGSVPYAMMRRSGFITSLSETPGTNECVTPVEDYFENALNVSSGSLHLNVENVEGGGSTKDLKTEKDHRAAEYDVRMNKSVTNTSQIHVRSDDGKVGKEDRPVQDEIDFIICNSRQRWIADGIVGEDDKEINNLDTTQHDTTDIEDIDI